MAVHFDHEKLDAYQAALDLVRWVGELLADLQPNIAAKDHLWRASESVVRNIVRGNSKRSASDRSHTFDVAYGSGLECAACLDVLCAWSATEATRAIEGKALLDRIVAMLVGLRSAKGQTVHDPRSAYRVNAAEGRPEFFFAHEELRVYQSALRFVGWSATLIRSESVGFARGRDLDRHTTGIVLNIAEGNGKFSTPDRRRFLDISLSSGLQAASSLDILGARAVITQQAASQGKEHLAEIVSMIGAMARSLR